MWTQVYAPVLNDRLLSALVASLPVVVLLGLLAFSHLRAHLAALAGLGAALTVAIVVYRMPPQLALMAGLHGACYGLLPIGWIVLNAIFLYDLTVAAGDFEVLKNSIGRFAADRRLQVLLIAFSFGAFIEGAAGFGTPVAISAAMLIGLGFRPLEAAGLALIGNTAPVAYGALGTPIIALAAVTDLPLESLSAAAGRKAMLEVAPACMAAGGSFAAVQFLMSNFHGPWLVDIAGSIVSMLTLILLLQFWQPKSVWKFDYETETGPVETESPVGQFVSPVRLFKAWLPWLLMSIFVFAWGTPQIRTLLNGGTPEQPNALFGLTRIELDVPLLHQAVQRVPPVVKVAGAEAAVFRIDWLAATGTGLLLAALLS
ncbi:MAG: L-lactate permease, partial [Planctomycetaceae bacterium]